MMFLCINSSDYVLIITTIFLGIVALFAPYYADAFKRKKLGPVLAVSIRKGAPDCHLTYWNQYEDPYRIVYYFRFEVKNTGKTIALNIENSIENIWFLNGVADKPTPIDNFTPINLKWSIDPHENKQNIHPNRSRFCNIGHLPTLEFETDKREALINPIFYKGSELRLILDMTTLLTGQPNCLPPGGYILQINTYSDNYKTLYSYFKIEWSGIWKDNLNDMLKELVITKVDKPQ